MTDSRQHRGITYRPEIDGLRAVAVLSIVAFHVDASWVPGGFTGVDIFFVISGYLITSIVWRDVANRSFSLPDFYRRRILRIAPAYLVATVATLLVGCLVMLPVDIAALARSALWSAVSLPNVYFWLHLDTTYFAPASDQIPLLHLWSLGVEEQFYLLWPVSLLLLVRIARHRVLFFAVLGIAIAGSFGFAEAVVRTDPKFAYYMLPARAGELLLGAVLALWEAGRSGSQQSSKASGAAWGIAVLLGYGLVALGFYHLDAESDFPGLNALLPCVGTLLLIGAGARAPAFLLAPLRWKPMVWVGLISYSLYLWHWPVLSFARYFLAELNSKAAVACVVAMILLSVLSYRYVEVPFRKKRRDEGRGRYRVPIAYVVSVATLAAGCAQLVRMDGLERAIEKSNPVYATRKTELTERTRPAYSYSYNCQMSRYEARTFYAKQCVLPQDGRAQPQPRMILLGDSNGAHYVGVMGAIAREEGFSFRNATLSSCAPLVGDKDKYGNKADLASCNAYRRVALREARKYDYVVLGAQWSSHSRKPGFKKDLARTVRALAKDGRKVVLLGMVPRFPRYDKACELRRLRLPAIDCAEQARTGGRIDKSINRFLRGIARRDPDVYYMDVEAVLCTPACSPYLSGQPVYYNAGHLSMTGSWEVGQAVVKEGIPLRALFKSVARAENIAGHRDDGGKAMQKRPQPDGLLAHDGK